MSLSRPTQKSTSPFSKKFSWNGTTGVLSYFDYTLKTKGNAVQLPFTFIPIDNLACVTGYSSKDSGYFYSNEVKSTLETPLDIKVGPKSITKGLWSNIKENKELEEANYTQSIYGMATINGVNELINIQFVKSANSAWIDFGKVSKQYVGNRVTIDKSAPLKTGAINYFKPTFTVSLSTEVERDLAIAADTELQSYFDGKGSKPTPDLGSSVDMTELTMEEMKETVAPTSKTYSNKKKEIVQDNFLSPDEFWDAVDKKK